MRARSSDLILLLALCAVCLAFVVVASPVPQLVAGSSSTSCSSCVPE
jgi:hypothetical protein